MYKYSEVEPMKYAYTNGVLLDGSADMQPHGAAHGRREYPRYRP